LLLRASGETTGDLVDARAITDDALAAASGVDHAEALLAFADAAVSGEPDALSGARERLRAAVGAEGLVDAAAVVANFERMVRIADSTGIPLDTPVVVMTTDLRDDLELLRYRSASNTPEPGALARTAGAALRRIAPTLMRVVAKQMARRNSPAGPAGA
jgi:hypothetical protein